MSSHPDISQLTAAQRDLLARRLLEVLPAAAPSRLVAHFTSAPGQSAPTPAELRRHLADYLPPHSIPAVFQHHEAFPLTPNGKIDRKALASATPAVSLPAGDPLPTEEASPLLVIWREILGNPKLGPHDNFFEAGGDSILSIQIVSRARKEGLELSVAQLFKTPTVAELTASAGPAAPTADRTVSTSPLGIAPLVPIQHWFFERAFHQSERWNQSVVVTLPAGLSSSHAKEALTALVGAHDALRLAFHRTAAGWQQAVVAPHGLEFATCSEPDLPDEKLPALLEQITDDTYRRLSLSHGRPLAATHLALGPHRPPRLVLAAHHLAIDLVSWGILLEDLESACTQLQSGSPLDLPAPAASFKGWAEFLGAFAQGESVRLDRTYWTARGIIDPAPLPRDLDGTNDEASRRELTVSLTAAQTSAILQAATGASLELSDYLLAALCLAVTDWSGHRHSIVGVEGHGREDLAAGIDLSRTIGWLTSYYPLVIESHPTPIETVKHVKDLRRSVPHNGIGYGLLRYLTAESLPSGPEPEILFNHLGRRPPPASDSPFTIEHTNLGSPRSPGAERPAILELTTSLSPEILEATFSYSASLHHARTIESLAQAFAIRLESLVTHSTSVEGPVMTPSDFPESGLSQSELDAFLDDL